MRVSINKHFRSEWVARERGRGKGLHTGMLSYVFLGCKPKPLNTELVLRAIHSSQGILGIVVW